MKIDEKLTLDRAYYKIGKLNDALDDLNTALQLRPNYKSAIEKKADVLLSMARFEDAAREYQTLKRINPKSKELRVRKRLAKQHLLYVC